MSEHTVLGQTSNNYYALCAESYLAARAALKSNNHQITPAGLPATLLQKYSYMRAEYLLAATRLQEIVRRSRSLPERALIVGLAEESARTAIISGHLSLLDVLPAELSRQLATRRLRSDYGAAEYSLHAMASGFLPGLENRADSGALPELSGSDDPNIYASLCKAGRLQLTNDRRWWEHDALDLAEDRVCLLRAAGAAECLIRMPEIMYKSDVPLTRSRTQHSTPQPLGHVSELLQGLTQLQEDIDDVLRKSSSDLRRRKGFLLSEFATPQRQAGERAP